jgi:sugar lactone lactonase YvrE
MNKYRPQVWLLLTLALSSCYSMRKSKGGGQTDVPTERRLNPADIALPNGYKIEAVAQGLTFPTGVTFDDKGQPYVIEAGYSYGEVWLEPKLLRINPDGTTTTIATGEKNGPWTGVTFHDGNFYVAEGGQAEGGKILRISPDGKVTALVDKLPSIGDHHTNGPVIHDGYIYFGQGTATNSAVVGEDNFQFGWLSRHPDFHDIPCKDIVLSGENYTGNNPLTSDENDQVTTGAYLPFGTPSTAGQTVQGKVPCTGAIMRVPLNGGNVELVAWGLRNPFGLSFSPDGKLFITENGYDDRGSRPVWGTGDVLWQIETGKWYGWPDYSAGELMEKDEEFSPPGKAKVKSVLKEQPNEPQKPTAVLGVHASANGFDFSRNEAFGYAGNAFVATFGDMAPKVGKVLAPVGFKVVRVDVSNGVVQDFVTNKGNRNGPASWLDTQGLERPVDAKFNPAGDAMYVVDFGIMKVTEQGPMPLQKTGVVWKITKQ